MKVEDELQMAQDTVEHLLQRVADARRNYLFWRDQLRRQQLKVASLSRLVSR